MNQSKRLHAHDFLHARLEDFLLSLLEWKLPSAQASFLKDIPLMGKKPRSSFTLDELAHFRGSNVDDLISCSIADHLERSNFNNPGEVGAALESIGLLRSLLDPYRDKLGPMMKRRHWIVHRADPNNATGSRHHAALGLQKATVETWSLAVRQFGTSRLNEIESEEMHQWQLVLISNASSLRCPESYPQQLWEAIAWQLQ